MSETDTSKLAAFAQSNAMTLSLLIDSVQSSAAAALAEDMGQQDLTAQLIHPKQRMQAHIVCREQAVICGQPYVEAVLQTCASRYDSTYRIDWQIKEGAVCAPNTCIATLAGQARTLLSAERSMLNFLQTLSGTANKTHDFVSLVKPYPVRIVDTRKTLPGLRLAQKYAVFVSGGLNHRMGLYDAILIKENHIASAGGVAAALKRAQTTQARFVQIEVETLVQFKEALAAGANMVLLDNMDVGTITQAVALNALQDSPAILEISGGVNTQSIRQLAATGIDRISIGTLTKDVQSVDFSMRLIP